MAEQITSFGMLVVGKAIATTRRFFASIRRDIFLALLCLSIGFGLFWYFQGLPSAMEQAASVVAFTLAPLAILPIAVFFWNLWLAPCELAYQALEQKMKLDDHAPCAAPNYAVWRKRNAYTILELASLLDNSDPGSRSFSSSREAYIKLLKEQASQGNLRYISENTTNYYGEVSQKEVSMQTKIEKKEAVRWAESMSFDVSEIK